MRLPGGGIIFSSASSGPILARANSTRSRFVSEKDPHVANIYNLDCPSVRNLAGASVLVAEDEAVIALEIEALLTDAGCLVLGPYTSAADSLAALRSQRPDVALL